MCPQSNQNVTFLYKMVSGVASSSFGLNVGVLAGLPRPILHRANTIAQKFSSCFDETMSPDDPPPSDPSSAGKVSTYPSILCRAG